MNFNNKKIWIITDGSQGMISQTRGLAQQLNKNFISISIELHFPWSFLQPGFLPLYKWIFKNKLNLNDIPNILISCGRKSVYLSLYLKKIYKTKIITIHIQNPKVDLSRFDYIIAPNHDKISGKNVIKSIGAIHQFTQANIKEQKKFPSILKKNLITVFLGGKNRHYDFSVNHIFTLIDIIIKLKKNNPQFNFLIVKSRRTDQKIINFLDSKLNGIAQVWKNEEDNPYKFCLNHSDFFVVTSDSTSMISECAFTGKPVFVYHFPFKRKSERIECFHNEFEKLNITRKFMNNTKLNKWNYATIDEAKRIAGILKEKIIQG